ncbi:mannitol 2-dehydrogenase [Microlunatus endophyticus]|uniref:Mannitol-1-phosphate 5-dehydrogenase n=1 Tax=Microlunatus endophyticus TaxID=1716077 RepID=A0A917S6D7_9ACTN|nr:mannitol dehydrogenase family protein [Microlunatus endophyticus]GGL61515.1 mannitol 2-dehydrogenase [Microlunatus endophyticus]
MTPVIDLSADLPAEAEGIALPTYDRSRVTAGIVHFGVGGFHRAHQAMYLDRLLREGKATDWGICGVGVLPHDARMRDVLKAQNGLYTLVEKAPDGSQAVTVIGSIVDYLFAPDDPDAVIEKMASEQIRIVSLTITEGGYNLDAVTGRFDDHNQAILDEVASSEPLKTVYGLVVAALKRRRERGLPPFTVMSCDNIQGNGEIAKGTFTSYARLTDPEFADWMIESVAFPNSMVDRITPATTPDDIASLEEKHGVKDGWPVVCEPFEQWVLQDHFPLGRPPYQDAGVQVVDDVEPYELMKLRLLNAGHQAIAYFGYLSGYRLVHESAQDPAIARFARAYMDREGTPTLKPVPGVDLEEYKDSLIERFANSHVRDQVQRLCLEASDRIPKFVLPVVRHQLAHDGEVRLAAAIIASLARYCEAVDEDGQPIEINDRIADTLKKYAAKQIAPDADELAFLTNRELFGDLVDEPRFTEPYLEVLRSLHEVGAQQTVQKLT